MRRAPQARSATTPPPANGPRPGWRPPSRRARIRRWSPGSSARRSPPPARASATRSARGAARSPSCAAGCPRRSSIAPFGARCTSTADHAPLPRRQGPHPPPDRDRGRAAVPRAPGGRRRGVPRRGALLRRRARGPTDAGSLQGGLPNVAALTRGPKARRVQRLVRQLWVAGRNSLGELRKPICDLEPGGLGGDENVGGWPDPRVIVKSAERQSDLFVAEEGGEGGTTHATERSRFSGGGLVSRHQLFAGEPMKGRRLNGRARAKCCSRRLPAHGAVAIHDSSAPTLDFVFDA